MIRCNIRQLALIAAVAAATLTGCAGGTEGGDAGVDSGTLLAEHSGVRAVERGGVVTVTGGAIAVKVEVGRGQFSLTDPGGNASLSRAGSAVTW